MTEAQLQRKIVKRLKLRSDVIWAARTPSMRIRYKIGEAGQPDITCVLKDGDMIYLLFLEVKLKGKERLRYEQRRFFEAMEIQPKTLCEVITDVKQLNRIIGEAKTR